MQASPPMAQEQIFYRKGSFQLRHNNPCCSRLFFCHVNASAYQLLYPSPSDSTGPFHVWSQCPMHPMHFCTSHCSNQSNTYTCINEPPTSHGPFSMLKISCRCTAKRPWTRQCSRTCKKWHKWRPRGLWQWIVFLKVKAWWWNKSQASVADAFVASRTLIGVCIRIASRLEWGLTFLTPLRWVRVAKHVVEHTRRTMSCIEMLMDMRIKLLHPYSNVSVRRWETTNESIKHIKILKQPTSRNIFDVYRTQ